MNEPHCGACKVLIPVGSIAFRVGIDRVVIDPRRHHGYRIANLLDAGDWAGPKVSWVCEQCYAGAMADDE